MPNTSAMKRGWNYDQPNADLRVMVDGVEVAEFHSTEGLDVKVGGITATTGGVTATAGGITATAGGITATAGGVTVVAGGLLVTAGRIREVMTPVDVDTQNHTLTAANIFAGIVVHTSTTGGGTITTDTAVNIVAAGLTANGQCILCYFINDGDQTDTFAGGEGVTIADTGQTVAENEAAVLLFRRVSATTVTCYVLGA